MPRRHIYKWLYVFLGHSGNILRLYMTPYELLIIGIIRQRTKLQISRFAIHEAAGEKVESQSLDNTPPRFLEPWNLRAEEVFMRRASLLVSEEGQTRHLGGRRREDNQPHVRLFMSVIWHLGLLHTAFISQRLHRLSEILLISKVFMKNLLWLLQLHIGKKKTIWIIFKTAAVFSANIPELQITSMTSMMLIIHVTVVFSPLWSSTLNPLSLYKLSMLQFSRQDFKPFESEPSRTFKIEQKESRLTK